MNPSEDNWTLFPFPEAFVKLLITGSLLLTGIGAVVLVALLIRDRRARRIW
jgi:hypothetical protein